MTCFDDSGVLSDVLLVIVWTAMENTCSHDGMNTSCQVMPQFCGINMSSYDMIYGIIPYNNHGSWFPRVSLVKYNPGINIGQTPQQTLQYKLPARFPNYTNGSVDVNFKPNKGKISSHFG